MTKFDIDYSSLAKKLDKRVKLSDVQNKIEKVAFGFVRFIDNDDGANLWKVQKAEDGQEYIVAVYEEELQKTASANPWSVEISDNNIHIFYKKEHLNKYASKYLGIPDEQMFLVRSYLPKKLADNKSLVQKMLKDLDPKSAEYLLTKYPELAE
jgi:hypothetical protein